MVGSPPLERVCAASRDDVDGFEAANRHVLDATLQMVSYPALMCGYRLVDEAIRDLALAEYLDLFLEDDVMPTLEDPRGGSRRARKNKLLDRLYSLPRGDTLLRIAHNGAEKLPGLLSNTLIELLRSGGVFERVACCLASFDGYIHGRDSLGRPLAVDEPLLTEDDRALLASGDPLAVLRLSSFAAIGLTASEPFTNVFLAARRRLIDEGPAAALAFAVQT